MTQGHTKFPVHAGRFARGMVLAAMLVPAVFPNPQTDVPEGVRVDVKTEPRTATVGDPIRVQIHVLHPAAIRIVIPRPASQLGDFALLAFTPGSRRQTDRSENVTEGAELVVAAYRTGALEIPGVPYRLLTADGRELTLTTPASRIEIRSVLSGKDAALKNLKKQAEIDEPFPLVKLILVLALVAVTGALIWWWSRRRRAGRSVPTAQSSRDPLELAEAELRDLLGRGLLERGFAKQFYVALSEIVRKVLAGGYGIQTAEKTTAEIMERLRWTVVPPPDSSRLARLEALLESCDLVKFAKYVPSQDEVDAAIKASFELLDHCRRIRAAQPDSRPAAGVA